MPSACSFLSGLGGTPAGLDQAGRRLTLRGACPQVAMVAQARYAEAFRREILILRSCHDRNIVQFLGACLQASLSIFFPLPCAADATPQKLTLPFMTLRHGVILKMMETPTLSSTNEGALLWCFLFAENLGHRVLGTILPGVHGHELSFAMFAAILSRLACVCHPRRRGRRSWCRSTWRMETCSMPLRGTTAAAGLAGARPSFIPLTMEIHVP